MCKEPMPQVAANLRKTDAHFAAVFGKRNLPVHCYFFTMNSYRLVVGSLAKTVRAAGLATLALAAGLAGCSRPPEHSGEPAMSAMAIGPVTAPAAADSEVPAAEVTVAAKAVPGRVVAAAPPVAARPGAGVAAKAPAVAPAERGRVASRIQAGRVLDESGQPLVGATIILRGTTKGTSTDISGSYMLEVPKGENTFVVGYAGYESETASSRDGQPLTVTLLPSPSSGPPPVAPRKRR